MAWRDFYAHRLAAEADDGATEHDPVAWRHDPAAFEAALGPTRIGPDALLATGPLLRERLGREFGTG